MIIYGIYDGRKKLRLYKEFAWTLQWEFMLGKGEAPSMFHSSKIRFEDSEKWKNCATDKFLGVYSEL